MPHRASRPRSLPLLGHRELLVAQLDPGQLVGLRGMRVRERHRHVEVGHPGLEGGAKDRHDEAGIEGVDDGINALGAHQSDDGPLVTTIELKGGEALPRPFDGALCSRHVEVGDSDVVEQFPFGRRARNRRSHAARSHYQYPHLAPVLIRWQIRDPSSLDAVTPPLPSKHNDTHTRARRESPLSRRRRLAASLGISDERVCQVVRTVACGHSVATLLATESDEESAENVGVASRTN